MACKSASVMTQPPYFLLQPKLICVVVLSSYYLLYDFNDTKLLKLKKKLDFFVLLIPLEILSQYPDIKISHWLGKFFQWTLEKVFREKLLV